MTQSPSDTPKKLIFNELPLHHKLKSAIHHLGFTSATPIQSEILPLTLTGKDAIGKAQTGTGKTAAFLITVINDLLLNPLSEKRYMGEPRALILAPTRELAQQIKADCDGLTKKTNIKSVCLLGGVDIDKQIKKLEAEFVDILVATPGRLLDMVNRKHVWLDRIELFVLDEADRMLDMGFIPDIKKIIRAMPKKTDRQSLLFSATFNQDVLNLAYSWLFEPEYVEIEPKEQTNVNIEQYIYLISDSDKPKLLNQVLDEQNINKAIIFANRRHQVSKIYESLKKDKHAVVMLSGEMSQQKREKHLAQFKSGRSNLMVATDVAGRGIHVDDVSHVINYSLPDHVDDYVHRIGRTGRAGSEGISISFASEDDSFILPELEQKVGKKLKKLYPNV